MSLLLGACEAGGRQEPGPTAPTAPAETSAALAVAAGEVTETGALVWFRASGSGSATVGYAAEGQEDVVPAGEVAVGPETDFTGRVPIGGLAPDTPYRYWVHHGDSIVEGAFRTAPAPDRAAEVTFAWSADLGGHQLCRREGRGYRVFRAIGEAAPDFFIAAGDLIYADHTCPREGYDGPGGWTNVPGRFRDVTSVDWTDPAAVRTAIRKHWRYNLEDPHLQRFRASTPWYAQWDDHEAVDDFGASWNAWPEAPDRPGYPTVVAEARAALFDYQPLHGADGVPEPIHRSFRWGSEVELFLLDARSYRSRNDLPDSPGKTMLGAEQREWLVRGVAESTATWKLVAGEVPLSIPTGDEGARDGWADAGEDTGFEHELRAILADLDAADVENLVFVVADAHVARALAYEVDADGDGDALAFHEFVAGPLTARIKELDPLDPTFEPRELFGHGGTFNFGLVRVVPNGASSSLRVQYRDEDGSVLKGSDLKVDPA